jgi:hypothetical protein
VQNPKLELEIRLIIVFFSSVFIFS